MSAGPAVGLPSLTGAKLVGYLFHAGSLVGAFLLAWELVRPRTRAAALAIVAGIGFLAVSLPANWWPGAGLETTFYSTVLAGRLSWAAVVGMALLVGWQGWRSVPLERHYTAAGKLFDRGRAPEMWFPTALFEPWGRHTTVPVFALERLPPEASLVYTDIGMTGWISDWTIIDVSGLTDEV